MDTYTIPPVGSRIILEVDLEHLLGASVALYVEEVGELTARNELVLARVDDLLGIVDGLLIVGVLIGLTFLAAGLGPYEIDLG